MHVSPHVTNPYMRGGVLCGTRYDVLTASMVDLIARAYGVDADKVQGGPSWLDTESPDTVKLMLQTLLADRFKLKVHMDSKLLPVFALSVGRGKPKLKESDGSPGSGCEGKPQNPAPGMLRRSCANCSMVRLWQATTAYGIV